MNMATAWSTEKNAERAVQTAYEHLLEHLKEEPQLVFLHCSASYDCETVIKTFRGLAPETMLHGGTSCLGVMTGDGFHSQDGFGLGMLGIVDPEGDYGVGAAPLNGNPGEAAAAAVTQALARAHQPGAVPAMVWITSAPGHEERVIEGIETLLGSNIPIAGGSSGDNDVSGQWRQFADDTVYSDAVVATVLFPSTEVVFAFHSGYEPTRHHGLVTRAEGRILHEIDGCPAVEVYDTWTEGHLSTHLVKGGNILAHTTLHPLGRMVGHVGNVPYFQLSHPDGVLDAHAMTLFADVEAGDELHLMKGTHESLVSRAGRVARSALAAHSISPDQVAGALVIYCAGCMLTVQERMEEVSQGVREALSHSAFLGVFTFGEQGCFIGGENRHGNLMISILIFSR